MPAFRIDEFITSINKNGILKNNKYSVFFATPAALNSYGKLNDILIRADSVRMPGMAFASADGPPRLGYGPTERVPYVANFEEISITFTIDANSYIHKFFNDWVNAIFNFKGQGNTQAKTKGVYEVGYKDSYTTDISIELYDDLGNLKLTNKVYHAFPMAFPSESLSWGDGQPIKLTIPFAYIDYEVNYPK